MLTLTSEVIFWVGMIVAIVFVARRLGRRIKFERELLESALIESFDRERASEQERVL